MRWVLALLPAALLAVFAAGLAGLIGTSLTGEGGFGIGNYAAFFARPDYVQVLVRTWWIAGATAGLCMILGYPVALVIAWSGRWRNLLLLVVVLPWLVSIVVRTYGWIVLLGNRGVINQALTGLGLTGRPVRLMFNTGGVLIGLVHVFVPFAVLCVLSSLLEQDAELAEAGISLGAGPFTVFRRIVLPLSVPGVITGLMLVYLMSTGAIVTPLLLGGINDGMLGSLIYNEVFQQFDFAKASVTAVILGASSLAAMAPLRWLERRLTANLPRIVR